MFTGTPPRDLLQEPTELSPAMLIPTTSGFVAQTYQPTQDGTHLYTQLTPLQSVNLPYSKALDNPTNKALHSTDQASQLLPRPALSQGTGTALPPLRRVQPQPAE